MSQILIVYTTLRGNTGRMVEPVAEGIRAEGVEARIMTVDEVTMADLAAADGIIIGSPTRFGAVDWKIKRLFDEIAIEGYPGPLEGKVGGAFTAGSRAGSGAELVLLNALHILLNHGLIIQGEPFDAHYGPVSIGEPNERVLQTCCTWGVRWARLVKRLAAGRAEPAPVPDSVLPSVRPTSS
ncbi:MAG: flavodoxin family protein [Dehalococcoidia bacterium]